MNPNKSRKFLVTINNPWQAPNEELVLLGRDESRACLTEDHIRCIFEEDTSIVKITGLLELAPTTGTEHLQMFV